MKGRHVIIELASRPLLGPDIESGKSRSLVCTPEQGFCLKALIVCSRSPGLHIFGAAARADPAVSCKEGEKEGVTGLIDILKHDRDRRAKNSAKAQLQCRLGSIPP